MSSSWKQVRTYADHLGHPVVLEQYVSPEYEPDPRELVSFQMFWDDEVKPLFEIYSYSPPDGLACIEHNRIEIARRKQQHRSGVENPLPLIPRFNRPNSVSNIGFCVLIRSHSYRVGYMQDSKEADEIGEGPDMLYFNRAFSTNSWAEIDMTHHSGQGEDLPSEVFELSTDRVIEQVDIGQLMILDIFNEVPPYPDRNALDIDEGEPPGEHMPTHVQKNLNRFVTSYTKKPQLAAFLLNQFHVSQEANIVTITNTPEGKISDIQYIVHGAFLSHIRDTAGSSLLESTARLFTASMVSNLPANKTLALKFFIPQSNSWSAIKLAQNEVLEILSQNTEAENGKPPFTIGALHSITTGENQPLAAKRFTPQGHDQFIKSSRGEADHTVYRMFTVVLDRARFVSEAGVYFYMTDSDEAEDPDFSSDDTIFSGPWT